MKRYILDEFSIDYKSKSDDKTESEDTQKKIRGMELKEWGGKEESTVIYIDHYPMQ